MALPETREFQSSLVALRALTYRDTVALWQLLDFENLDRTWSRFAAGMVQQITAKRVLAIALAGEYLTTLKGEPPLPVEVPGLVLAESLDQLRMASVVAIKLAMVARTEPKLADRNALVRTMGVADQLVGNGARELITATSEADPDMSGWERVTLGTCEYCASLAGDTKSGTLFPHHPNCGCQPEPVFKSSVRRVILAALIARRLSRPGDATGTTSPHDAPGGPSDRTNRRNPHRGSSTNV